MTDYGADASVVIPLLTRAHPLHRSVSRWADGRELVISGHAELESFSVLTRLRTPFGLDPDSAHTALRTGFGDTVRPDQARRSMTRIAEAGVSEGAVYDALVALAAVDADLPLATADPRAFPTYGRVGARFVLVTTD